MSALGQRQTCAAQKGMSALPPKADIPRLLGSTQAANLRRRSALVMLAETFALPGC